MKVKAKNKRTLIDLDYEETLMLVYALNDEEYPNRPLFEKFQDMLIETLSEELDHAPL